MQKEINKPPTKKYLFFFSLSLSKNCVFLLLLCLFDGDRRGEKGTENCSFRSMLQENLNSSSSEQQILFTPEESSSNDEYNKQVVNRGSFSLDQNQGLLSTFQIDSSSALYGNPSSMLQGLLGPENNNNMGFPHYGSNSHEVPQFLRASPPNTQPPLMSNQLHFTNNAPFWNASEAAAPIKDVRSSFFPSMQPSFSTPNFDVQSKVFTGSSQQILPHHTA